MIPGVYWTVITWRPAGALTLTLSVVLGQSPSLNTITLVASYNTHSFSSSRPTPIDRSPDGLVSRGEVCTRSIHAATLQTAGALIQTVFTAWIFVNRWLVFLVFLCTSSKTTLQLREETREGKEGEGRGWTSLILYHFVKNPASTRCWRRRQNVFQKRRDTTQRCRMIARVVNKNCGNLKVLSLSYFRGTFKNSAAESFCQSLKLRHVCKFRQWRLTDVDENASGENK